MITSRQIRAARALLGWSQQQLADKAIVSLNAVARLEKGMVDSKNQYDAGDSKGIRQGGRRISGCRPKRRGRKIEESEVLASLKQRSSPV